MNSAAIAEVLQPSRADHPGESRPQLDGKTSMATVILFDCLLIGGLVYARPSTTHGLSSGVAGTMAANKSGLQGKTIRNLLMAWVLTLPMAIVLSGTLYWLFTKIF